MMEPFVPLRIVNLGLYAIGHKILAFLLVPYAIGH